MNRQIRVRDLGELRRARQTYLDTINTAGALRRLGREDMAAALYADAEAMAGAELVLAVECIVHRGPFDTTWPLDGDPGLVIEGAVCGPCSAAGGTGPAVPSVVVTEGKRREVPL
jgi:hypothetical protein